MDWYIENGMTIFTREFLYSRGKCCNNGCRHCPYKEKKVEERKCFSCNTVIPEERIEALPETAYCVHCASRNPPRKYHDPNIVCAKASASGQNGFSPRD